MYLCKLLFEMVFQIYLIHFIYYLEGTADWHWLRKFSLTSSQAHHAFKQAIPLNQNDEAWIDVAEYLHGTSNWRSDLKLPLDESNEQGSTDNTAPFNQWSKDRLYFTI